MWCTCRAVHTRHRCCWGLFVFPPSPHGWGLEVGIEEYREGGWRVNTAGYLCVFVYFLSWGSARPSKSGSCVFFLFLFFNETSSALWRWCCRLFSSQPLWCCLDAIFSPWWLNSYPILFTFSLSPSSSSSSLSVADQPSSISCFWRRSHEERASWPRLLSRPDLALIEGLSERERKKERASMAEVQYCGLKWLMAYGKSCYFSPPLSGRPALLCFYSLCVFEPTDYIRTNKQEDPPNTKTERSLLVFPFFGFSITLRCSKVLQLNENLTA